MLRRLAVVLALVWPLALAVDAPAATRLDIEPGGAGDLYLSVPDEVTLPRLGGGTVRVRNEDVVFFDASRDAYAMVFDGSNVGLSSAAIDALMLAGNASNPMAGIFLSFTSPRSLPGLGTVDDSDVVLFVPSSLGAGQTTGHFETFLDGSDIGLTSDGEDIDAVDLIDDQLFLSTTGSFSASSRGRTAHGQDEDLLVCDIDVGAESGCASFLFTYDLTAVGFDGDSEDVDGFAVLGHHLFFSSRGSLTVPGVSAANEDVVHCDNPNIQPEDPANRCDPPGVAFDEYFDGGDHGIVGNVSAIEVPLPPGTE